MAHCIGIDLHRNRLNVCKICENGQQYQSTVESETLTHCFFVFLSFFALFEVNFYHRRAL